jgi:hypothetical protein
MTDTNGSDPPLKLRAKNLVWNAVRRTLAGGPRRRELYRRLNHLRFLRREGLLLQSLGLRSGRRPDSARQPPLTWTLDTPRIGTLEELLAWLRSAGLRVDEGGHTIYVPPQDGLAEHLGPPAGFYPEGSGFKVLRDLRGPDEAHYLTGESRKATRVRIVGTPRDQLVSANYLHAAGLGPRVHDVCCWRGDGFAATVFVMEHVQGRPSDAAECAAFLERLRAELEGTQLSVLVPYWESHMDFQPDDCNGNLVVEEGSGEPRYVDFQNFGVRDPTAWTRAVLEAGTGDLHFGQGREERGDRYLYQTVPGIGDAAKRDIDVRWNVFRAQLERGGVDLADRVVLDVGCNAGMMLHAALSEGAAWGLGWDLPNVARHTRKLLWSLGDSRFRIIGAQLHDRYDLRGDIPAGVASRLSECVLFYLAVREHIGVLPCLSEMPWRALVFEGHQGDPSLDEAELRALFGDGTGRILMNSRFADGDCSDRPVAVLVRD